MNTLVTDANRNYKDIEVPDQSQISVSAKMKDSAKEPKRQKSWTSNKVQQMPSMNNFLEEEKKDLNAVLKEDYPVVIPPDNSDPEIMQQKTFTMNQQQQPQSIIDNFN